MLKLSTVSVALLCAASLTSIAKPAAAAGGLDAAVLEEVNFARTQPAEYARVLRTTRGLDMIGEDPRDVAEAIDFLSRQQPLPPLAPDSKLGAAAQFHTALQGRSGQIGHVSPNGATLSQRLDANGVKAMSAAENISYGYDQPRAVVRQLIVDTGVPDRGHRRNIFGHYEAAGVSCGGHAEWGSMCVIDFAGAFQPRKAR